MFWATLGRASETLDDIKSKIREEKDQEIQRQEQEAIKYYMPHFSVDRQGKVAKIKYVTLDSSRFEVKTDAVNNLILKQKSQIW